MNLSLTPIPMDLLPGSLEAKGFSLPSLQKALSLDPTLASGAASKVFGDSVGLAQTGGSASLASLSPAGVHTDDQLKKVSKDFESIFMRMLFKQMRSSVEKSGIMGNSRAMEFFENMRDDQLAENLANSGGLGIGNMIYQKLKEATDLHQNSRA